MRILFLLYYFPPALGSAAKRNSRIYRSLASHAEYSHILSATGDDDAYNQNKHSIIERITSWDYRRVLRGQSKGGAVPEHLKQGRLQSFIIRVINTFPFNILIGEGGYFYYQHLINRGKKIIREKNITHLYSSYRPFADHYAAYKLKQQFPNLFWIADFRDLPIDPDYNQPVFQKSQQSKYEKIFSKADLLTTVSDGLAFHLKKYHPNVITLRNGIESSVQPVSSSIVSAFTIVYTGSIYQGKRNAEPVFQALQQLISTGLIQPGKVKIIYAGKDSEYWKALAAKYQMTFMLEDKGVLDGKAVEEIQKQACINLLLSSSSPQLNGILTGKLIEYLEAGSPVLAIFTGEDDLELKSILHELETGETFTDQPSQLNAIQDFILHEYNHWMTTNMNRKPVRWDILNEKYSMDSIILPVMETIK